MLRTNIPATAVAALLLAASAAHADASDDAVRSLEKLGAKVVQPAESIEMDINCRSSSGSMTDEAACCSSAARAAMARRSRRPNRLTVDEL